MLHDLYNLEMKYLLVENKLLVERIKMFTPLSPVLFNNERVVVCFINLEPKKTKVWCESMEGV